MGAITDDRRSIIASDDRSYDQSWFLETDRMTNRGIPRPITRFIMVCCDRSYDQSLRPATDRMTIVASTIDLAVSRTSGYLAVSRKAVRKVASSRTTELDVARRVTTPIVRLRDQLHNQSRNFVMRDNPHDCWSDHIGRICNRLRFGVAG